MYFTGLKQLNGGVVYYSNRIEDPFWNYVASVDVDPESFDAFRLAVEDVLHDLGRKPAFYITPASRPTNVDQLLTSRGYEVAFSDAWLIHNGQPVSEPPHPRNLIIKPVGEDGEMDAFVRVFNLAYGSQSEGPYSGLPASYGESLLASYRNQQAGKWVKHYLALLDDEPVGCATLVHDKRMGGLYNLGVVPKYGGKHIGPTLATRRVSDGIDAGLKLMFFQTEEGTKVERFYQERLHFTKLFAGKAFVKKEES
jgi:hypothetical protein